MKFTTEVNASGVQCPKPIFMATKAMKSLNKGDVLKLISTDKGSIADIQALCNQVNYELIEQEHTEQSYTYFIKK